MSDMGDMWREVREEERKRKDRWAIDCPGCKVERPKANPTRLLPGQRCRVCGHRAPRSADYEREINRPPDQHTR